MNQTAQNQTSMFTYFNKTSVHHISTSLQDLNSRSNCEGATNDDLGIVLAVCLQELIEVLPRDPIEYMSQWLHKYADTRTYYREKCSHYTALGLAYANFRQQKLEQEEMRKRRSDEIKRLRNILSSMQKQTLFDKSVTPSLPLGHVAGQSEAKDARDDEASIAPAETSLKDLGEEARAQAFKLKRSRFEQRYKEFKAASPSLSLSSAFSPSKYSSMYSDISSKHPSSKQTSSSKGDKFDKTSESSQSSKSGKTIRSRRSTGTVSSSKASSRDAKDKRDKEDRNRGQKSSRRHKRDPKHAYVDPRATGSYQYYTKDRRQPRSDKYGDEEKNQHEWMPTIQDTTPEEESSSEETRRSHGRKRRSKGSSTSSKGHRDSHKAHKKGTRLSDGSRRAHDYEDGQDIMDGEDVEARDVRGYQDNRGKRHTWQKGHGYKDDESSLSEESYKKRKRYSRKAYRDSKRFDDDKYFDKEYRSPPFARGYDERYSDSEEHSRDYDDRQVSREYKTGLNREERHGKGAQVSTPSYGYANAYPLDSHLREDFSPDDERRGTSFTSRGKTIRRSRTASQSKSLLRLAATWYLTGSPPVLTCNHPILGILKSPHRARVSEERADLFWGRAQYLCQVLFDNEIYTVCDPDADDDIYKDRMAEWTGSSWILDNETQSDKPR